MGVGRRSAVIHLMLSEMRPTAMSGTANQDRSFIPALLLLARRDLGIFGVAAQLQLRRSRLTVPP